MNENISIIVNGETQETPPGLSVSDLLQKLGIPNGRVAIERNLQILPRTAWSHTKVSSGDRYEIVHFVGGG